MINFKINPQYSITFKDFILNIKAHFLKNKKSIHKARNEIKILERENCNVVVKSFKIPHFINKVVYGFFRDSKAKKSYENSMKIIDFVPEPIGYIEFKTFFLLFESYFISKEFPYDFTIREPLLDSDFEDKHGIFEAFALFTQQLHDQGIEHLDYSPGNILIKKESSGYIFKIVDINRMQFKILTLDERLKNFSKLWAKDEDLKIMIKSYARFIGEDEHSCIEKAIYYSQKNKDIKNFKKRLKGKKVVD